MSMLLKQFEEGKAALERDLSAAPDVKAACDIAARFLDDLRRQALDQMDAAPKRTVLNQMMGAAQSGLLCMASATQVDISMRLLGSNQLQVTERRRKGWRAAMAWLPCGLCAVLGIYLFLNGTVPAAILAGVASAASLVQPVSVRGRRQSVPDVTGTTRVDAVELSRRMERMVADIDAMMEAELPEAGEPVQLSAGMLEAVQMLMEAHLTGDGQFALKALPQMTMALERQGIDVMLFDEHNQNDFDLLPAVSGGQTIRPALVKDGVTLVRGQATIEG